MALSLGAEPIRPGHYWVPEDEKARWRRFAERIEQITGGKVYSVGFLMDEEGVRALRDAIVADILGEASRLREEIERGTLGDDALEARKQAAEELRQRAARHAEILGDWAEKLDVVLGCTKRAAVAACMKSLAPAAV